MDNGPGLLWTERIDYGPEHWFRCELKNPEAVRKFSSDIQVAFQSLPRPRSGTGATIVLQRQARHVEPANKVYFVFCATDDDELANEIRGRLSAIQGVAVQSSTIDGKWAPPAAVWRDWRDRYGFAVIVPATRTPEGEDGDRPTLLWSLSAWAQITRRFLAEFQQVSSRVGRCKGVWLPGGGSEVYFDDSLLLCLEGGSAEMMPRLLRFVDEVVFGEWALDQEVVYVSAHVHGQLPQGLGLRRKRLFAVEDTIRFYDSKSDLYYELWGEQLHWGIFKGARRRSIRTAAHYTTLLSLSLLDLKRDDVFLDLACGAGASVARAVDKAGCWSIGLDASAAQLRHAEMLCSALPAEKRERTLLVHAIAADQLNGEKKPRYLPFRDGALDKVLCQSSFYYFHKKELALRDISRCLRDDGVFIMDDMLMEPGTPSRVRFDIYERQALTRVFSLREYQRAFAAEHLEIVLAQDLTSDFQRSYEVLLELLSGFRFSLPSSEAGRIRQQMIEGFELLVEAAEQRWVQWWLFVCRRQRRRDLELHAGKGDCRGFEEILACPFCLSPVRVVDVGFKCPGCSTTCPRRGNVVTMLRRGA